jgi:hypothetical protein
MSVSSEYRNGQLRVNAHALAKCDVRGQDEYSRYVTLSVNDGDGATVTLFLSVDQAAQIGQDLAALELETKEATTDA